MFICFYFRTVNPARIRAAGGVYRLSPTRIDFGGAGGGSARLAGSYGRGTNAQVRLDRLDLTPDRVVRPVPD